MRDGVCAAGSSLIIISVLAIFAVIFVVPLVQEWPYQVSFTLEHVQAVLNDSSLFGVYKNSIFVAVCTALAGLLITYGAALATARSGLNGKMCIRDRYKPVLPYGCIPGWLPIPVRHRCNK